MTPDELVKDLAELMAGLQVARSIQGGFALGTALPVWDRLHQELGGFGWKRPEDYEQGIRKVLGLTAEDLALCEAKVHHGPGHQSSTRCELKGPHDVHRAVYGSQRQEATWRGPQVFTGAFDEPPADES